MILIAESGSTKCDWVLLDQKGREIDRWKTMGFNPYFHSSSKVEKVLRNTGGLNIWADKVSQTWFYGAGCSSPKLRDIIKSGLDLVFNNSDNHVGHDLEAAAFALYSGEPEIACILGTGSNSCYFDGTSVSEEVPSLAYILGDEASASFIGKRLVADYFYLKMPTDLMADFKETFNPVKDEVIDRVYNKPNANVYLASFGPFAGKHTEHAYIKEIVSDAVRKFIEVHVACFANANEIPVNFVGSVAKAFEDIISGELNKQGFKLGHVLAKPVNSLVRYHLDHMKVLDQTAKTNV